MADSETPFSKHAEIPLTINDEISLNPEIPVQNNMNFIFDDPYFLSSSDISQHSIVALLFSGSNYVNWSRSVKMALYARNKVSFIDGTLLKPSASSSDFKKWIRNDYIVRSWIINSIERGIAETFIFVDSAYQLWKEIKDRYGQSNVPQLFDLHRSLFLIEQKDSSITKYYAKKKRIWDEIHDLEGFPDCSCGILASCSCGIIQKLLDAHNRMKLIQFLSGINPAYDQVKTNILSTDPLPNINKVYHILQSVERQHQNNLHSSHSNDISAFVAHQFKSDNSTAMRKDFKKSKIERICEHCKGKGHTIDQCFKLIGYPEWYANKKSKSVS